MLHRLALRDFVIVDALEIEFATGFGVLTGETGAGKSILVDALQLALGGRGDAGVVREGAARADIAAEFDTPPSLAGWLVDGGFDAAPIEGEDDRERARLLFRRTIDAQGKSRAWINGSPATVTQLREAADHLVDIHGQHAWQGLTRAPAVRALLDGHAGHDPRPLAARFRAWRQAVDALADARSRQGSLERERERLAWQIGELETLGPGEGEWAELEAEHTRLAHGQSLIDAARGALEAIDDAETNAVRLVARATAALDAVHAYDAALGAPLAALRDAEAQLADAARTLASYLSRADLDPERLRAVDERLSAWLSLARRHRVPPAELPTLLAGWKREAATLEAATDLDGLSRAVDAARAAYDAEAALATAARRRAAPVLGRAVTEAMQKLGMTGGRFAVELVPTDEPQAHGRETPELLVAGHAGATPRPLGRVASGGELSRLALAIAVVTSTAKVERAWPDGAAGDDGSAPTLVFDEVDAGIGGAVAETVGRLLKQLGRRRQVLAVTHLPQVAASADHHHVVAKRMVAGRATSAIQPVAGEERVAEIARMLGGEKLSSTTLAHAEEMLDTGRGGEPVPPMGDPGAPRAGAAPRKRAPKGQA
jgi:DNA repair protein RecN (Recombination protein N)